MLHGAWELVQDLLRECLVVVLNGRSICHTASVLHFQKEDTGQGLVLLRGEIHLKDNANIIVVGEEPEAFVLSVVDLARHEFRIRLVQHTLHSLADWGAEEVSLEFCELIRNLLRLALTDISNLLVLLANFFRLLLSHRLLDLYSW